MLNMRMSKICKGQGESGVPKPTISTKECTMRDVCFGGVMGIDFGWRLKLGRLFYNVGWI